MKLTREEALKLHRRMWSDMKRELGDNPTPIDRLNYKMKWCAKYFPNEHISGNCFLCEYTFHVLLSNCKKCPIIWPKNNCVEDCYYQLAPLSEILKLSKRKPAIIDKIITKWNGEKL